MAILKPIDNSDEFIANSNDKSLFIEAGAGAGKTYTMVGKIINLIISGVEPQKIIAITFTKKAAEKLLIDITKGLDSAIKKEKDPEHLEKLVRAFNSLHKMKISTIHSFCYQILSEYAFEAQIPYGVEMIEEEDLTKNYTLLYNKWKQTLTQDDLQIIEAIVSTNLDDVYKMKPYREIEQCYLALCTKMEDVEVIDVEPIDVHEICQYLNNIYLQLEKYINHGFTLTEGAEKFCEKSHSLDLDNLNIKDINDYYLIKELAILFSLIPNLRNCGMVSSKKNTEISKELKEEYKNIFNDKNIYKEKLNLYFIPQLVAFAKKAYKFYLDNKDASVITNDELIYKTYYFVKNSPKARDNLAHQYDVIFVDEFQDTDTYQISFLKLMAQSIDERKKKEEKENSYQHIGSLVVVGDPKQSIYYFRGADFQSYMKFQDEFTSLGKDHENRLIPYNYRSMEKVLSWINDTYQQMVFFDKYDYKIMRCPNHHQAINSESNKDLGGVYTYKLHENKDFTPLVNLVDYLVKNHYRIMVEPARSEQDKQNNTYPPYVWKDIEYSDFMIIFAYTGNLQACAKAFLDQGIPCDVTGKYDVANTKGIRELIRIASYLLLDDENSRKTAINILKEHLDNPEEELEKIREDTLSMSSYGKVYYVFENYFSFVNCSSDVENRNLQSSIYQILEKIFKDDNQSNMDLSNALFTMCQEVQSTVLSTSRKSNAVKIMNSHQTKGLQENIVIFLSFQEMPTSTAYPMMDKKLYLDSFHQHPQEKEQFLQNHESEKLRLEYVVATRPRQILIFDEELIGLPVGQAKRFFHMPKAAYNFNDLTAYQINPLPDINDLSLSVNQASASEFIPHKLARNKQTFAPTYLETTPSKLEQRTFNEEKEEFVNGVKRPKDNLFGTMLHRLNELYILEPNINFDDLISRVMKENNCDNDYYRKYLKDCLFATKNLFIKHNFFNNDLKPEYKFYYFNEEINTLINGSIDLLMFTNDEIIIIDYKSDSADYRYKEQFEGVLKANYQKQLFAYQQFISQKYPDKKINLKIVWYEEINGITNANILDI